MIEKETSTSTMHMKGPEYLFRRSQRYSPHVSQHARPIAPSVHDHAHPETTHRVRERDSSVSLPSWWQPPPFRDL